MLRYGLKRSVSAPDSLTLKMIKTDTFKWNHLNMDEQKVKWDMMMDRQSKGKCIVCGKALPPSFGTIEAITKFSCRQKVTLSFCIPCMNT